MWLAQARAYETLKRLGVFLSKLILSQSQHLGTWFFLARNGKVALSKHGVSCRYPSLGELTSLSSCHHDCRLICSSLRRQRIGRGSLLRQEIRSRFHLGFQSNLFGQNSFVAKLRIKKFILKLRSMTLTYLWLASRRQLLPYSILII